MTDIPAVFAELRQWSRERLEAELATARLLAQHETSAAKRDRQAARARLIRRVLDGMEGRGGCQSR